MVYENWNNFAVDNIIEFILPLENIEVIQNVNLKKNNGVTDFSFRKKMAHKIYKGTSSYDKIISDWLDES